MNLKSLLFFLLAVSLLSGCRKGQLETDIDIINDYLDENGLTADRTTSGLHFIIDEPGTGDDKPKNGDVVDVIYKGYFTDGTVFDESEPEEPFGALLVNPQTEASPIILGWNEGLRLFKEGGKGTIILPSKLGYGRAGSPNGDVPPNTVLIFDIEVVDF